MDASRILKAQGWRGLGYTLHPTDNTTGLARPLLLSRKDNRLGLGSESVHRTAAATDQWWLEAFDQQLQGLSTPGSVSASGTATPTGNAARKSGPTRLEMFNGNQGASKYRGAYGLYASFVRGETIGGTSTETTVVEAVVESATETPGTTPERDEGRTLNTTGAKDRKDKKRKRADDADDEEQQRRREKKAKKELEKATKKEAKEEKTRLKKTEKKAEKRAEKKVRRARKKEEKERTKETETKEERRIRRAAKRTKKAARREKRSRKEQDIEEKRARQAL